MVKAGFNFFNLIIYLIHCKIVLGIIIKSVITYYLIVVEISPSYDIRQ